MSDYPHIPGAKELFDWFGYWPNFHDANLLTISREPDAVNCSLHAFRMTREVDERGYYVLDRHAVVWLHMTGLREARIDELIAPNVLLSLNLTRDDQGFRAEFFDVYGVETAVACENIAITIKPGKPDETK